MELLHYFGVVNLEQLCFAEVRLEVGFGVKPDLNAFKHEAVATRQLLYELVDSGFEHALACLVDIANL